MTMRRLCKCMAAGVLLLVAIAFLLFGSDAPGYARATLEWLRDEVRARLAVLPADATTRRGPDPAQWSPVQAGPDREKVPHFRAEARAPRRSSGVRQIPRSTP